MRIPSLQPQIRAGHRFEVNSILKKEHYMNRKNKARRKQEQLVAPATIEARLGQLKSLGFKYIEDKDYTEIGRAHV